MKLSELVKLLPGYLVLQIGSSEHDPLLKEKLVYIPTDWPIRIGHNRLTFGFSARVPVTPEGVHSTYEVGIMPVHTKIGEEPADGEINFGGYNMVISARAATSAELEGVEFSYS